MRISFLSYFLIMSIPAMGVAMSPWAVNPTPMQFSAAQRDALIKKFAPEARFHIDEQYYPMNIDSFLKSVELKNNIGKVIIPRGEVTSQKLAIYDQPAYKNYYIEVPDSINEGNKPDKNGLVHSRMYANFMPTADGAVIQYLFFYPFNGPFQIGELPGRVDKVVNLFTNKTDIGIHKADWEHVNVNLKGSNPDALTLKDVYFARHRPSKDGGFEAPEIVGGTHPVVYLSRFGHAAHAHYKDRQADEDATSNNGPKWQTWEDVVYVGTKANPTPGNEWLKFAGYWGQTPSGGEGKDSPPGPIVQDWFRTDTIQRMEPAYAQVTVQQSNAANKLRNSPDFEIKQDVQTFVRKLLWEIKVETPGIKPENIMYDIYDGNNKLLWANLPGPRAMTPFRKEKFHVGNVRVGGKLLESNSPGVKFQLTLSGLLD